MKKFLTGPVRAVVVVSICLVAGRLPLKGQDPAVPLHVEGNKIKDPAGKVVILRGVNQPGFVDIPDGSWDAPGQPLFSGMGHWKPEVVKGALDEYKKYGFNVVRLHTIIEWWKSNPETYKDPWRSVHYPQPYRQMITDIVQWAGERGIYVIFDFYAMKNVNGIQSGQESMPWPPYNRFPDVVSSEQEFLDIWKSVGKELGGFQNVLFEFYNEPHGDQKAEAAWFAFSQKAIDVLRAETQNLIVIQWDYMCWVNLDFPPPENGASTLAWIEKYPLKGENLVYATHLYRNTGNGGGGSVHRDSKGRVNLWGTEDVRSGLELALFPYVIEKLERPLLVTEIGAWSKGEGDELDHELQWFKNTLDILGEWNIGYIAWAWRSDEHLDHGMLHNGKPNAGGRIFLNALDRRP